MFTGKELDSETGLYYFGARYYDPRTSVWASTDPILASYMGGKVNGGVYEPRQLNLYAYAGQHPVNNIDPDGRCYASVVGFAGGAAIIDGPVVPIGDAVGGVALAGSCVYRGGKAAWSGITALAAGIASLLATDDDFEIPGMSIDDSEPFTESFEPVDDPTSNGVSTPAEKPDALIGLDTEGMSQIDEAFTGGDIFANSKLVDLPLRDGTGKVHGDLPNLGDLGGYDTDDLVDYRSELQGSVAERIRKNIEFGSDVGHSQRQANEQAQIERINKILSDRGVE